MAFKMKGSPMARNFGIGTSPAKQANNEWVLDASGNKKYKKGSTRDKDNLVIEKSVDRDKHGGKGTTSDAEQKALEAALIRSGNQEVEGMSKAELLKASGKKANLVNKVFSSKKKLKKNLKNENSKNKQQGAGPQVMSTKTKEGLGGDEYTGVTKKNN